MSETAAPTGGDMGGASDPFAAAMADAMGGEAEVDASEGQESADQGDGLLVDGDAPPEQEAAADEPAEEKPAETLHKVKIDGEEFEVSTEELKNGYMRQRAFTKKTQEVAARSKELAAEKAALTGEKEKVRGWFKALVSPNAAPERVVAQLERAGVPMREIVAQYAEMMAAELEMPEGERIKRERARWEAQKRAEIEQRQQTEQQQQHAQQVDRLRKTFAEWLPAAITEAKLPQSKFVKERISMHLQPVWRSGKALTREDFVQAAQLARAEWMEERSGLAPDDLAEELTDAEKRRALALALQKKTGGAKPPPVVRPGSRPAAKTAPKPAGPMSFADEMRMIRGLGR